MKLKAWLKASLRFSQERPAVLSTASPPGDLTGGKGSTNSGGKHRAMSQESTMASWSARNPVLSSVCLLFQTTGSSGLQKHTRAFIYHFLSQKPSFFQQPLAARPQGPARLLQAPRATCIIPSDTHPSPTLPSQRRSKHLKPIWPWPKEQSTYSVHPVLLLRWIRAADYDKILTQIFFTIL